MATDKNDLTDILEDQLKVEVQNIQPVFGGDISKAFRVTTREGDFFFKTNHKPEASSMLTQEEKGLMMLGQTGTVNVPRDIKLIHSRGFCGLYMEFIHAHRPSPKGWRNFGLQLSNLHRQSTDYFGFGDDNWIGSLKQYNKRHKNWAEFYANQRLRPQVRLAFDAGFLDRVDLDYIEGLYGLLADIFPHEPPSLLHGDLWNGNLIFNTPETPVVIDPAVYYGHREMDLAMTLLFGGFSDDFYDAYHSNYNLNPGWDSRKELCQLYYLLVHLNLFGKSYLHSVRRILRQYS